MLVIYVEKGVTESVDSASCLCLLQFTWPTVSETEDVKETQMLYKFDYLPPGLFNRAQVGVEESGLVYPPLLPSVDFVQWYHHQQI